MRKKVFGRKFSRDYGSRKALFRSLIRGLVIAGSIDTTYAKAKSIQGDLDKLTNLAIEGSLSHYKMIVSFLGNDESTAKKLVERTKSAVGNRSSGFTRIVKLPARRGDNAQMARLEWVDKVEVKTKGVSDKSKKEDRKGKVSGVEKKDISSKETKKPGLLGRLKKSVGSK